MTEKQVIDIVDKQLEEKFDTALDKKLDALLDKKFRQFSLVIFKHIDERFAVVDARFEEVDRKFSKLQSAVDGIATHLDTDVIERTALEVHVERHGRWIKTIASKTGTTLK